LEGSQFAGSPYVLKSKRTTDLAKIEKLEAEVARLRRGNVKKEEANLVLVDG
jgi:hypothetical protein